MHQQTTERLKKRIKSISERKSIYSTPQMTKLQEASPRASVMGSHHSLSPEKKRLPYKMNLAQDEINKQNARLL
jgi:hypothetical protein